MNDIKMGLPEPRWSQCNDGDLWNQIWIILRSRGSHSVRVTKVKGHATIQHLVDGAVEPIDKYCNDMADSLATYAREHRSDNMGRISDFFAQRHKYYVSFLTALHDYLLAMLKAIAEARDTHAKQARANGVSHSKVLIAPALLYPARDDPTAALDLNMLPQAAFQALPNGSKKLLAFLASFRWCLAPNGQQGVSWLELLIVFCAQGGLPADLGISTDTGPRPSLRTVLLAFSRSVKALTPMYLAQHSQIFFKPSKFAQRRCRSIGYTNHCACIAGLPDLGPEQAISVTRAVISLRHSFTRNSEKLHQDGQMQLLPRKFSYRGALPENWSALDCSVSFPQHNAEQVDQWLQSIQLPDVPEISTLKLHCPVCNVAKECKNHTLLKGTKWCSILCAHCHRARTSAKWQCSCNKPWYLCPTHGPIGHAVGAGKAKQPTAIVSQVNYPPAVRIRPQPFVFKTTQEDRKRSCQSVSLLPEPKRPALGTVRERSAANACVSDINRTTPEPSLVRPEAGVGVSRVKAKRRHRPSDPETAPRIRKKRRMTETELHLDALASIKRLRESRAMDPG